MLLLTCVAQTVLYNAGSHVGLMTILASKLFANIDIYAFEPIATTYFYWEWNVAANGITAHGYNNAVCTDNRLTHALGWENASLSSRLSDFEPAGTSEAGTRVAVQCLDFGAWILNLAVKRIGLVKLACEGCEEELLSKHARWFDSIPTCVVGEAHLDWQGFALAKLPDDAHAFLCGPEGTDPRPFFVWPFFAGLSLDVRAAAACIPRAVPLHVHEVVDGVGETVKLKIFPRDLANPAPRVEALCRQHAFDPLELCITTVCSGACPCTHACLCACARLCVCVHV